MSKIDNEIQAKLAAIAKATWPKLESGDRFEYWLQSGKYVVCGRGSTKICTCDTEDLARTVTAALNLAMP